MKSGSGKSLDARLDCIAISFAMPILSTALEHDVSAVVIEPIKTSFFNICFLCDMRRLYSVRLKKAVIFSCMGDVVSYWPRPESTSPLRGAILDRVRSGLCDFWGVLSNGGPDRSRTGTPVSR